MRREGIDEQPRLQVDCRSTASNITFGREICALMAFTALNNSGDGSKSASSNACSSRNGEPCS